MTPQAVRIARSDSEIAACWPVMRQLRGQVPETDFLKRVRQQERNGYRLAYLVRGEEPVAVAGFHVSECLAVGRYLYVEDLVTVEEQRSRGHGSTMLEWLCDLARNENCVTLRLDSGLDRVDARRFYERHDMTVSGFHFLRRL